MAKKGQAVQLQIEVNNDEEWEKLMQKDGLIIIDVYSEWCGPCLGMQANLKKIKLEFGGDLLQLAVAKSDGISALERFRNKSEPTWMFVSKGKMVNLMFGADAPKLTRLILAELKKEQLVAEGQPTDRTPLEILELSDEEKVRYDAAESIQREIREKEERKKAKELLERRTKECENILENLANFGTALVFPSARDKYKEALHDILDEAGLMIHSTEKITMEPSTVEELCYFTNISDEFTEQSLEELYNNECLMVLFKIASRAEIEDIDDAILTMIYGHKKHPPGDPECVAQKLFTVEEETEETAKKELVGIWVPPNPQVRATALRMFFPKISQEYTIPEPPPEPEHLAIIFPLTKKEEALEIMHEYPNEIMKHGIFTSEIPEEAKFIAKSLKKLDKMEASERTYSEKIVLQVSKRKSECIFAFAQLEPLYMSPNAKEGKRECETFFPDEYESEPVEEEEEEIAEETQKEETDQELEEGEEQSEVAEGDEVPEEGKEGETVEAGEAIEGQVVSEEGAPEPVPPPIEGVESAVMVQPAPPAEMPQPPSEEPVPE